MLGFTRKLPFVPLPHLRARDTAGEGGDFFELGEYVYGQDARLLSPTACLRYQKPMVRVFQAQALSHLHIFLLPSPSLLLGTPTKLKGVVQICELLLQSARVYGLKPLLHYLDAHEPKTLSTPSHIRALLGSLKALRFAKRATLHKTTSAKLLHHLIAHRHQKGLGVVIGDFYKLDSHAPIASLKHHLVLYALCVRSMQEWEPSFLDSAWGYRIHDIETNESCTHALTLARYKENLARYDTKLSAYFAHMGAKLAFINPQASLLPQLQRIFHS